MVDKEQLFNYNNEPEQPNEHTNTNCSMNIDRTVNTPQNTVCCKRDASTCTDRIIVDYPIPMAPCEHGTSIGLNAVVWKESDEGILVVNAQWRGSEYIGSLMDVSKQDWRVACCPFEMNFDSPVDYRFRSSRLRRPTKSSHQSDSNDTRGPDSANFRTRSTLSTITPKLNRRRNRVSGLSTHNSLTTSNSKGSTFPPSSQNTILSSNEERSASAFSGKSKQATSMLKHFVPVSVEDLSCRCSVSDCCRKRFRTNLALQYHISAAHGGSKSKHRIK